MLAFFARRAGTGLLIAFFVSLAAYALAPLAAGGDPAITALGGGDGLRLTEEEIEASRRRLGLDQPFFVRYGTWAFNAVQADLGKSLFRDQSVSEAIMDALPVTVSIASLAAILSVIVAIPFGILAAIRPNSPVARLIMTVTAIGIATPGFVAGLFLVRVVSIYLGWLPAVGYRPFSVDAVEWLRSIILPAVALTIPATGGLLRFVRASMMEVLQLDYVRTAIGKGLPSRLVIWKHALKNALIPVVTVLGLEVRVLLGGAVAVEAVFALPGMGTLAVNSITQGDYPILLGTVMVSVLIVVLVNMAVDLSYALLNPKVRVL